MLVGKSDIWAPLMPDEDLVSEPILKDAGEATEHPALAVLDMDRIERISAKCGRLLLEVTPEVVSKAEDFSDEVVYMPVSALGHSPEKYPDRNGLLIKPKDVHPRWVTIPLLYSYARWATGLIAGIRGGVKGNE